MDFFRIFAFDNEAHLTVMHAVLWKYLMYECSN